jgi:hypothetical protein
MSGRNDQIKALAQIKGSGIGIDRSCELPTGTRLGDLKHLNCRIYPNCDSRLIETACLLRA